MDELGVDRSLMFPTLASLDRGAAARRPGRDPRHRPRAERVARRGVGLQLQEPHLHHPGDHPAHRREGDRGAGVGGQARCPRHPDPACSGARLPRAAVVRAARVRPVLAEVRRARRARRDALQSDSGYSRYTSEWDGAAQEMLPFQTNAMGILNEWRPVQDAVASWVIHGALFRFPKLKVGGHRGRVEVDVPAAGQHGRGVEEGARGLPRQPDRGDQEPHPRQPVLRGGHRRPDQPHRRGAACSTAPTTRTRRGWPSRRTT